ncbi:MAG: NAD(P)H-hydrate dehydratase, partial [Christensenellales bacterium]|nr:NAD(P)H-hydrate dehydratase [Christensenellales bacterium]
GSTGAAFDPCVRADATVTFQYLKTGLCLADGLDVCGAVTLADVGFPRTGFGPMDGWLLESADLPGLLPTRPRNLHKGRCGHLLIVAGAMGMAGAAVMCARGALRSGAGLVSIACPLSIVPVLQALVPQAMCIPLPEQEGVVAPEAAPVLRHALSGKTAAVVGCGLSRRAAPEAVLSVLESGLPAVIDADGLNLLSESPALLAALRPHHILTPHPGEAARLLTALPDGCQESASPLEIVRKLGKLGATVLYKGAACIAFSPEATYISASGCSGMAKGGSGDVLSGILGALLAEPSSRAPALTAALASELHGLSGERAQARYGNRSMNAMDIPEFLPEVFPS